MYKYRYTHVCVFKFGTVYLEMVFVLLLSSDMSSKHEPLCRLRTEEIVCEDLSFMAQSGLHALLRRLSGSYIPECPSSQKGWSKYPDTITGMVFGALCLGAWVVGLSEYTRVKLLVNPSLSVTWSLLRGSGCMAPVVVWSSMA